MYNARYLQPQVNTAGLVAHYKLWAGAVSSGKVFDYSLEGNLGTLQSAPPFVFPGVEFDGSADWIEVSDSAVLDFSDKMSISAWIYLSNRDTNWPKIVIKPHSEFADPWEMFSLQMGNYSVYPEWRITDGITSGEVITASDTGVTLTLNQWYHIVGTYNGSLLKLYINGQLADTTETSITIGQNNASLGIGGRDGTNNPFPGRIGDVMLFNLAKSATEIRSIYEVARQRYGV